MSIVLETNKLVFAEHDEGVPSDLWVWAKLSNRTAIVIMENAIGHTGLYEVHDDGAESLLQNLDDVLKVIKHEGRICMELEGVRSEDLLPIMTPRLVNRADGCDGTYCIARTRKDGAGEYWHIGQNKWCSAGTPIKVDKS